MLMFAPPSEGAVVLGLTYSNSTPTPGGTSPWITATFSDVAANTVRLTLDPSNLVNSEAITSFYFNVAPSFAGPFTFDFVTPDNPNSGAFSVSYALDDKGSALKGFDFELDLPPPFPGGANWITSSETVVLDIIAPGLTAEAFNEANAKGYFAAAHIQRISPGDDSAWIAAPTGSVSSIPEPGSSLAIALLLSTGLSVRLRRRH